MNRTVQHEGAAEVEQRLRGMAERMERLEVVNDEAQEAALSGPRRVSFDPTHAMSLFSVQPGRVVVGSKSKSYFRLLDVDVDAVRAVYREWVLRGA